MDRFQSWLQQTTENVFDFVASPPQKKYRWLDNALVTLLYIGGVLLWSRFMGWGKPLFTFHDWSFITYPRLTFLQNAILTGQFPLHMLDTDALGGATTRYFSIPDVIISPQVLLLRYLDIRSFSVVQVGLLFTIGFLGLVWIRRRYHLSIFAFSILFVLFNFNGHILAHITAGHLTWAGTFLYSWFALWILELLEGKVNWQWVAKVALLLFIMLLQGAYHQYVWALFFMGILAIVRPTTALPLVKTAVFSILLSMARILPPALLVGEYGVKYEGGFVHIRQILQAMIDIQAPGRFEWIDELGPNFGGWEMTLYTGVLGAAFLIYFGFYRQSRTLENNRLYRVLLLPSIGLIFLSLDQVYALVRRVLPIPPFSGERFVSRIIILAFVFVLVLAVIEFQSWLNTRKGSKFTLLVMISLAVMGVYDLMQNYLLWTIPRASEEFSLLGFYPPDWVVNNKLEDTSYIITILVGLAVMLASLAFLGVKVWKEKRMQLPARVEDAQVETASRN